MTLVRQYGMASGEVASPMHWCVNVQCICAKLLVQFGDIQIYCVLIAPPQLRNRVARLATKGTHNRYRTELITFRFTC